MGNRFKDPTLRREYDAVTEMWRTKHRNLFTQQGERRRSPDLGSSLATMFWLGFDGRVMGAGWDAESKRTIGYAHWRAGQDAAKSPND